MKGTVCTSVAVILLMTSCLLHQRASCQGYYPLAIGNQWDYGELLGPGEFQYLYSINVVGDTVMPNGETYSILRSTIGNPPTTDFRRQEGSRVYAYSGGGDSLLYDFSLGNGDTLQVIYSDGDTAVTTVWSSLQVIFDEPRMTWRFNTVWLHNFSYSFVNITDSLGLTWFQIEPGYSEYLMGAIIDGRRFGTVTHVESDPVPVSFSLHQNYPNPFNSISNFEFRISNSSDVSLKIFNLLGEELATLVSGQMNAGTHTVQWDATGQSSGAYFYTLRAGTSVQTKKMILLK